MSRKPPTPRPGIYEYYWRFASARHVAFERRVAGAPPPWSDDPILQTYKFCNVFRAADRVSQYMIRDVCYHTETCTPADRLFQIIAFRIFSNIQTWQTIQAFLGHSPTLADLASGDFTIALEHARSKHGRLYTGAFILCAAQRARAWLGEVVFRKVNKRRVVQVDRDLVRHEVAHKWVGV